MQGVDGQRQQVRVDPPAHRQLRAAVPVHIAVSHAVNGGAAALNNGGEIIGVLLGIEDIDLQRLLVPGVSEEGNGLLPAVPVQVRQLHRLEVGAGDGSRVLRAAAQDGVDAVVQLRVLGRQLGQAVQVLGIEGKPRAAAGGAGQQQRQRPRRQDCPNPPSHTHAPLHSARPGPAGAALKIKTEKSEIQQQRIPLQRDRTGIRPVRSFRKRTLTDI